MLKGAKIDRAPPTFSSHPYILAIKWLRAKRAKSQNHSQRRADKRGG
jgi:hypothetical protein